MRHLRPFWEVHRHRASPETGAAIAKVLQTGWLTVYGGRILGARVVGEEVDVTIRLRATGEPRTFRVGAVINCTGPATDVRTAGDPLLDALFHWGQARPDPLGLGIQVAEDGAVIGHRGEPSRVLFYVGPLLRAATGRGRPCLSCEFTLPAWPARCSTRSPPRQPQSALNHCPGRHWHLIRKCECGRSFGHNLSEREPASRALLD